MHNCVPNGLIYHGRIKIREMYIPETSRSTCLKHASLKCQKGP